MKNLTMALTTGVEDLEMNLNRNAWSTWAEPAITLANLHRLGGSDDSQSSVQGWYGLRCLAVTSNDERVDRRKKHAANLTSE